MKIPQLVSMAIMVVMMAACTSTRNAAPIVDRSSGEKKKEIVKSAAAVKPVETGGSYTVKKGDTLFHIALDVGQNYRDLVSWNNLANPNDIKIDQVLRVTPPSIEKSGAQVGNVVSTSGIEVRSLTASPSATISSAPLTNKITPLGTKQVYSDAALLELQKPDVFGAAPVVPEKIAVVKAVDKLPATAGAVSADDASVAWIWPTDGKVIATFNDGKKGIDIAGKMGQQILAAGSGKVMYAGSGIRGYGNLVIVKHTNNLLSAYAHNKTVLVKEGQAVSKGEKIAEMGDSDTESVKLHFEIRQQGKPVDPSQFLPGR